jgi:hypothetical protein
MQEAAHDLQAQAAQLSASNDTSAAEAVAAEAKRAELISASLALDAEDTLKNTTRATMASTAVAVAAAAEASTQRNNPELAKLLQDKAAEMNTTVGGVEVRFDRAVLVCVVLRCVLLGQIDASSILHAQ